MLYKCFTVFLPLVHVASFGFNVYFSSGQAKSASFEIREGEEHYDSSVKNGA